jgi:hypothetical protein
MKYFLPAAFMMCAVYGLSLLPIQSMHALLLTQVFVGMLIYWLFSVIFKVEEYYEIRNIIKTKIKQLIKKYRR